MEEQNNNLPSHNRKIKFKWIFYLILFLLVVKACIPEKREIPKEGDVVTWVHSSELIIKTKLGQRREHIPTRNDSHFYEPEYEKFVGQFPIDYVPESFPKMTEQEHHDFFLQWPDRKQRPRKSIHFIEFYLMLDGVEAVATDDNPYGGKGIDDPNQVKVFLHSHHSQDKELIQTTSGSWRPPFNTKQFFESDFLKELETSTKETINGVDCYRFIGATPGKRCFGHSTYPSVSGFTFWVNPNTEKNILVSSKEFIYGGIEIVWFTDQQNINKATEIDAAIWRLLEAWNIAPSQY